MVGVVHSLLLRAEVRLVRRDRHEEVDLIHDSAMLVESLSLAQSDLEARKALLVLTELIKQHYSFLASSASPNNLADIVPQSQQDVGYLLEDEGQV